eukprot:TRINITY_DN24178_c0_g1_i1.p1 TRINITY_DN24178_c0_g1~~TRINITY_DN24178_c0_g1_i1.p1  ORF type:complete len:647 (+),score=176.44 TRINITY_DN24178_c0_g1_i1:30-1943(+)
MLAGLYFIHLAISVTRTVERHGSIQDCIDASGHDDTCKVPSGVYRENVMMTKGIRLEGEEGTVLDGSLPVTGPWSVWKRDIYVTTVETEMEQIEQIFFEGTHVPEARWPNAKYTEMLDVKTWATAKNTTSYGYVFDPAMQQTNINWTGAIAVLNSDDRVLSYTRTVVNFTGTSFNYDTPLPGEKPRPLFKYVGSPYYLFGILDALDSPGEWYFEPGTKKLYMWSPDSSPPGSRVSYRTKDICLTGMQADPAHPMTISNMAFKSCTFTLHGVDGADVHDVNITYPTYARQLRNRMVPAGPTPNVTLVEGNNSVLQRVSIKNTNVAGVQMIGSRNTLQDSLIMNVDWVGSLDYPPVLVGFGKLDCTGGVCGGALGKVQGEDNVITRNTVKQFGNSGIVTSQLSIEVSYNHVHSGGLIGCDHAGIHADNKPTPCMYNTSLSNCTKEFHHNWVHDCREKCIRGDDATVNMTMHHNVAWNCGYPLRDTTCGSAAAGLVMKGDYNVVYDITVFNVTDVGLPAQGDLVVFTAPGPPPPSCKGSQCKPMNKHSQFFNIAATVIATHFTPLNQSAAYTAGLYTEPEATFALTDPAGYDFTPTASSPLRGSGAVHPPYTEGKPDIGAVQSTEPKWVPGCTSFPECGE